MNAIVDALSTKSATVAALFAGAAGCVLVAAALVGMYWRKS